MIAKKLYIQNSSLKTRKKHKKQVAIFLKKLQPGKHDKYIRFSPIALCRYLSITLPNIFLSQHYTPPFQKNQPFFQKIKIKFKNISNLIAIYSRKSKFTGKGESIGNQAELCREYIRTY